MIVNILFLVAVFILVSSVLRYANKIIINICLAIINKSTTGDISAEFYAIILTSVYIAWYLFVRGI